MPTAVSYNFHNSIFRTWCEKGKKIVAPLFKANMLLY